MSCNIRKRPSQVCENCRKKKIRCDKRRPCSQCVKAKSSLSCTYSNWFIANSSRHYSPSSQSDEVTNSSSVNLFKENQYNGIGREQRKSNSSRYEDTRHTNAGLNNSDEEKLVLPRTELENLKTRLDKLERARSNSSAPFFSCQQQSQRSGSLYEANNVLDNVLLYLSTNNEIKNKITYGYPLGTSDEEINFYSNDSSIYVKDELRRINYGSFSWPYFMKRDPSLFILWEYMLKRKFGILSDGVLEVSGDVDGITSSFENDNHTEKEFKKKALESEGYGDTITYDQLLKSYLEKTIPDELLNNNTWALGLTFYDGRLDREFQLIDKIKLVLPKQKVIWKLIDRFFSWLYPFMPFLDEIYFREQLSKIIGHVKYNDEKLHNITVEKRLDLASLGILLIILRLTYFTLFCNKNSVNENNLKTTDTSLKAQEMKYLLSNPININVIDVAQSCLDQFQLWRRTSLTVLQCAMYLKLYHIYAPESGDGADGGDSQISHVMLIQMAYSLGLNREPGNFHLLGDRKFNHLGRKIWHSLVMWDIYYSHAFGLPLHINPSCYDTKVPHYVEGCENVIDRKLEEQVIDSYAYIYKFCSPLSNILRMILRLDTNISMLLLTKALTDFELLCSEIFEFPVIQFNPLNEAHWSIGYMQNVRTKLRLDLKCFLISLLFHFYLHYETEGDNDLYFFYFRKMLLLSTNQIMPHYFLLLGSDIYCDFIINPSVEMAIHKANQVHLAAIIRINCIIVSMQRHSEHEVNLNTNKEYETYFNKLCKLVDTLRKCAEVCIAASSKICTRYYYAWRITKAQKFLLKTVTEEKFYIDNYDKATKLISHLSNDQLDNLIEICQSPLNQIENQRPSLSHCDKSKDSDRRSSKKKDHKKEALMPEESQTLPFSFNSFPSTKPYEVPASFEDVNSASSSDIDKLWIHMVAMKNDNYDIGSGDNMNHILSNSSEREEDRFLQNLNTHFDLLNGLPLNEIFETDIG